MYVCVCIWMIVRHASICARKGPEIQTNKSNCLKFTVEYIICKWKLYMEQKKDD